MPQRSSRFPDLGHGGFLIGLGSAFAGMIWLWVDDPKLRGSVDAPLLPLFFGFALPTLIASVPLVIAAPFLARPGIQRILGFLPATSLVILFVARRFTMATYGSDSDLPVVIGATIVLQLGTLAFLASKFDGSFGFRRVSPGSLACLFLLAGIAISGTAGLLFDVPAGLLVGAILLAAGGLSRSVGDPPDRSPWIVAERRVSRFARLLSLLRDREVPRRHLVTTAVFFGLTLASLAWIPELWPELRIDTEESEIDFPGLSLLIGGLLAGFGIMSGKRASTESPWWRPSSMVALFTLGSLGAFVLLIIEPSLFPLLGFLIGLPLGLSMRMTRNSLLSSLESQGHRLPEEIEALILTSLGGATLVFAGCGLAGHWIPPLRLPVTFLFVATFLGVASTWWRGRKTTLGDTGSDRDDSDTTRWFFDAYLPGFPMGSPSFREIESDGRAITILYDVPEQNRETFLEAIAETALVRRRQGALHWRLSRDLEDPRRFTESYLLESWSDYQEVLRHESPEDRAAKQRVFDLNDWNSLPYESHQAIAEV